MNLKGNTVLYYWIFGILIVVLLLVLGGLLLFSQYFSYIPANFRFVVGIFILAYGAFRLVTIYYKLKSRSDEDE